MTPRTRYFLIGSALVVVVGLCTGLVAYYNGNLPLGRFSSEPTEFSYLPADSTAVGYADVRAIMNSEFRQRIRQMLPTGEEKDKLQAEIGIDIERDIDSVVASFTGGDPMHGGGVVLVRGRFNDGQIETTAVQHGAKAEEYRGKRMLLMSRLPKTHEGTSISGEAPNVAIEHTTGGLVFLEPGLIALGDSGALKRAIDAHESKENVSKNAEIMKLVGDVQAGSNAWIVGRFDAISQTAGLPQQIKDHLPAVQLFAISAQINGGVNGTVRAETRDAQAAQDLRAVVNGGLAAARLMAGQDPKASSLLNGVQVGGVDKTVTLSFALPSEILDVLNGVAAMHRLGEGDGVKK